MIRLKDYEQVVGPQTLEEIRILAGNLKGKRVLNVNSAAEGGGVAEILNQMVPLMREIGVDARWEVMKGPDEFYAVTKKIHNALHGQPQTLSRAERDTFFAVQKENRERLALDEDIVFIHDPQPVGFVEKRAGRANKWVWRCHVDVSEPDPAVWDFLRPFVERYDKSVFSAPEFSQKLPIPQALICPSIDPLSDKNRELSKKEINAVLRRLKIPRDKPLVTQVSRFDRLKDPVGVIKVFKQVRPHVEARLLLVGGTAEDDPEGAEVLAEVREAAGKDPDILILPLPPGSNIEVNAIQRASSVILQKSLKEGFGLTITEALWKGKPVIASAVGGIPLQITHKYSGILTYSVEGAAFWLKQLLHEPAYAKKLGENGREHVRSNFLMTRQLRDYLLLFLSLYHEGDVVNL